MILDRAELAGTGAALAFHIALIAAMSLSLAHVASAPEPPAMEVELVEDVGLEAAAPAAIPPPSQAPEIGEAPVIEPAPAPAASATATSLRVMPAPARPQKPAPAAKAPRVSRIGDDFLTGMADDAPAAAKPTAAKFDARAKASIGDAILRQVKPCANRQPYIGEGANQIRLTVNLKLNRNGRLARPPSILRVAGDEELRTKYSDILEDQVRRIFAQCTPLRLPPDLYDTPTGGWGDFTFIYRVD